MVGAILGDIVGSIYEFDNLKSKEFPLFQRECTFTDDTVMTIAVAKALIGYDRSAGLERFKENLVKVMHHMGGLYPDCGYGGNFLVWVLRHYKEPYNSCGNGSAMRVSSVGWFADSLEEAEELAQATAEVTHNHPEGIKGAQATAAAIYMARSGNTKEEIRKYITDKYYDVDFTLDEIRPAYDYEITCQKSVPQALEAFFESTGFEDAVRNAVSIGGDSDTIAAITGSVAEAYYGIDDEMKETALSFLDDRLLDEYCEWSDFMKKKCQVK